MAENKSVTSEGSKEKQINALKEAGNQHMARGAFGKAVRIYNKAIELDPNNALLYSNRSAAYFNLRNFEAALEDALKAVQLAPNWWKAYKRKGMSLLHLKYYEEAIATLEQGLALEPENEDIKRHLQYATEYYERVQSMFILPDAETMKKLEEIPVFIVADEFGQPFFVTHEDDQQVCTFYFDYGDALETLKWIKQENSEYGKKAKVLPIGLSQAFYLAQEAQKNFCDELDTTGIDRPGQPSNQKVTPGEESTNQRQDSFEHSENSNLQKNEDQNETQQEEEKNMHSFAFQFRPSLKQVESAVAIIKAQIQAEEASTGSKNEQESQESGTKKQRYCPLHGCHHEEEEEELTVENFNGIPIFQAKGLTLLQNGRQLVPLFFSKEDCEKAWSQLVESDPSLPKECDMDVGTLEDILQRIAQSTALEFESVIFVASRESLKVIGKDYPLDEIHGIPREQQQELLKQQRQERRMLKKQLKERSLQPPPIHFPTAREVAAAGGSPEAIREAILRNIERKRLLDLLTSFQNLRTSQESEAGKSSEDTQSSSGTNVSDTVQSSSSVSLRERARAGKWKRRGVASEHKHGASSSKEVAVQ
jgi:tetratricopeptide (TPR) repeat protein